MNKKGFTLIELLSTIVILGIVVTLAFGSYAAVTKGINNKQKENIIKNIEIAASKYAFDTREEQVLVQDLINNGYLDGNEEGQLIDPVTKKSLNCYKIEMIKVSDYYKANFQEQECILNNQCNINSCS